MIPFSIDLLRPGEFAHTRFERFLSRQGGKRLAIAYALGGLLLLGGGYMYWERTAPLRAALTAERQRRQALQTQIARRQQDVTQMQSQFQVIGELEKLQVVWSEVLQAVSERMPASLWLNRIELVPPETKPPPQAAAGALPAARPPGVLRLEIVTELGLGSAPLIDVARFLDELGHDRRFSQRFQLMDWEALSAVAGSGEAHKERIVLTVSFKVVL